MATVTRAWGRHCVLAAVLAAAGAAAGQGLPPAFPVRGYVIEGELPLPASTVQAVLQPFVREDADLPTLQAAAAALEQALQARGHDLYQVRLPPQVVAGTVRLQVVAVVLESVRIEGARHHGAANLRRALPALREGATPDLRRLAVQAALANENPSRQVQVRLREGQGPTGLAADLAVDDQRPWSVLASLASHGQRATGRDRFTVAASHHNLFDRDHQLRAAWTTSLDRPGDVRQLGLSYRVPLYGPGLSLEARSMRSDVVGQFGDFRSTGAGHALGVSVAWYRPPRGAWRDHLVLEWDDKVFDATRIDDLTVPGQVDRRSRPLVLGYAGDFEAEAAQWHVGLELAANLPGGAGNDLAAYQSEDARIATHRWRAMRLAFSGRIALGDWGLALRAQGQASGQALIAGEQFGLGGPGSVRGTRQERALAGDRGAHVSLELQAPTRPAGTAAVQPVVFVDLGRIGRKGPLGPGQPASDIIASVGAGLRASQGPAAVSLMYGRLVRGSRADPALSPAAPRSGDDRLYLTLTYRF